MSGILFQVPVHGVHGKAEHEHGEGSAHVNPLSYDFWVGGAGLRLCAETRLPVKRYIAYCTSHTGHPRARHGRPTAQCGLTFFKGLGHVNE